MTEPSQSRRQIYHQGFWDGACFAYAIANAYKALTGHRVTRQKWDRAVEHVPDPLALLRGVGSTELTYEEAVGLIESMLGAFGDPGETFEVDQLKSNASIADLCHEISQRAVLLFAFGGPTEIHSPESHIVCGVATSGEPRLLHIACSAAFSDAHLRDGEYVERFHSTVGRYSNDSIAVDGLVEVAPNWRWRLTLMSPAVASR